MPHYVPIDYKLRNFLIYEEYGYIYMYIDRG